MVLLLAAVLAIGTVDGPGHQATQQLYARGDAEALAALLAETTDRELALLCRYRLYPLAKDPAILDGLARDLKDGTARELALLSGLWAYQIREAPPWQMPTLGRRSQRLLDRAVAADPTDPFVLLIEGQSLLYRPALFGGDKQAALDRFRRLRQVLADHQEVGLSVEEAQLWEWYALVELDDPAAEPLRQELLKKPLPPLFRQFLLSPPQTS